jgi:hypothetical protein
MLQIIVTIFAITVQTKFAVCKTIAI